MDFARLMTKARAARSTVPVVAFASHLLSTSAHAQEFVAPGSTEPLMLGIEGGAWTNVASPQLERFGPGGHLGVALHMPVNAWLIPSARLRVGIFADGAAPQDVSLRDPGVGGLGSLTLNLRLRPEGFVAPSDPQRGRGAFIEIAGGVGVTGPRVRPVFEAAIGWGFEIGEFDLAPVVRFVHVVQFDEPLDDRSAFILSLGAEFTLFDARPDTAVVAEHQREHAIASDPDRDHDGILNADDACPDEPEDRDGFEDANGCPDPDNDADAVLDVSDACPLVPEDHDGFEDDDGCREDDNDQDGILDSVDRCPNDPETINGIEDADGCPDEGLIVMINDRIVLEERVLFDTDLARVRHAAHPILHAVLELVRQHPEWALLRVEGHADVRGTDDRNLLLSTRRARAVMERLVQFGLASERIEMQGFGESRPVVSEETNEGHQLNRRVEIVVARRAAGGVAP